MSVIYKKATTREQVIKYIRDLDIYHIKELKRLGIYNKVKIVETNDVKKMYHKTIKDRAN